MRHFHLLNEFYGTPWAILPQSYAVILAVIERWTSGVRLSDEEIRAAISEAPEIAAQRRSAAARAGQGAIAVLPVYGILSQRGNMVDDVSGPGGTSTQRLGQAFSAAVADETVGAIVLEIDSPGGSVYGIGELANTIYSARGSKPIIAVANSLAASAAYWVASAADEIVVTPSGELGSIGVLTEHKDESKALEAAGVKKTIISAGRYKAEGSSLGPLSGSALEAIQGRVDEYYDTMVKDIARGRNVPQRAVREGFGEGRTLGAARAVKEGMADRFATLDQVLGELLGRPRPKGARAEGEGLAVRAASRLAAAKRELSILS